MYFIATDGHGDVWTHSKTPKQILEAGCASWTPPSATTFFGADITYNTFTNHNGVSWIKQGAHCKSQYFGIIPLLILIVNF